MGGRGESHVRYPVGKKSSGSPSVGVVCGGGRDPGEYSGPRVLGHQTEWALDRRRSISFPDVTVRLTVSCRPFSRRSESTGASKRGSNHIPHDSAPQVPVDW